MSQKTHWKKIGFIGRPHGLRGSFYLGGRNYPLQPLFSNLLVGEHPDQALACKLTSLREQHGRSILTLDLFPDRNALENASGLSLWAPAGIYENPLESLLGLRCVDHLGFFMGTVSGFANHGASDIIRVTNPTSRLSLDLPFVESYADTSKLPPADGIVRLRTSAEIFEDLWS